MTYYKIAQNGAVVDAGYIFLRWVEKHRCLMTCDPTIAEFVQAYDRTRVYHDHWLRPVPAGAPAYESATVTVIGETEYDEIRALLDDGEEIPVTPAEPDPPPVEPDEPVEPDDRPMTVAEMREKITEQQASIDMLIDCILEMSEVVYGG